MLPEATREGLLDVILSLIDELGEDDELQPILLSVSDNGAQMIIVAHATRWRNKTADLGNELRRSIVSIPSSWPCTRSRPTTAVPGPLGRGLPARARSATRAGQAAVAGVGRLQALSGVGL